MNNEVTAYLMPLAITLISIATTAVIAVIAFFLKRYIDQSDERNNSLHNSLTHSYDKLSDVITELKISMSTAQVARAADTLLCSERHKMLDKRITDLSENVSKMNTATPK